MLRRTPCGVTCKPREARACQRCESERGMERRVLAVWHGYALPVDGWTCARCGCAGMRRYIAESVSQPACGSHIHEQGAEGVGRAEEGREIPATAAHAGEIPSPCMSEGWAQKEEVVDSLGSRPTCRTCA